MIHQMNSADSPVVHRVLAGVLKNHHLLKGGQIALQKSPLTAASNKRRIGYQLLLNEATGSVFLDLFLIDDTTSTPCFDLGCSFLAVAWMAPSTASLKRNETPKQNGVPDLLIIDRAGLSPTDQAALDQTMLDLGVSHEEPALNAPQAAQILREMARAMDKVHAATEGKAVDWSCHDKLGVLSYLVASQMSLNLARGATAAEKAPVRSVPAPWVEQVAQAYKTTVAHLKDLAPDYFYVGAPLALAA